MNKQVKKPNVVRGGIAIPLGRNYYYMAGRKHKNGGIDIGKNPRTGLEVEDGEVMHISDKNVKVFSSVPFLNGKSPAQKVLGGENPNTVFKQQEYFKDRNGINDDGTKKNIRTKAKMGVFDDLDEVADKAEPWISGVSLASAGATLAIPNPITPIITGISNIGGGIIDGYQAIRYGIKGNYKQASINAGEAALSLLGVKAIKMISKNRAVSKIGKAREKAINERYIAKQGNKRYLLRKGLTDEQATEIMLRNAANFVDNSKRFKEVADAIRESEQNKGAKISAAGDAVMDTKDVAVEINENIRNKNKNNKKAMGGLSRFKDYGSKSKPYPKVKSKDFAGKGRSYPIPTKADAVDALRLAGLHGRDDVKSKVYRKYPTLRKKAKWGLSKNDTISLAANVGGSLISAGINAAMLSKLKSPNQPISAPAVKLKTNININPQLDKMRETIAEYERNVDNNTLSSRVALARKQNARLAGILQTNELYGEKENKETELINADKLNQQAIAAENIKAYNDWNDRVTAFENDVLDKQSENIVNSLGTINQGVQDTISRIEQRDSERQTRLAMLAAYPNVNPRILRTIGVKGITDADVANWEKIYYNKKNKQLSDRLNETLNKKFTFKPATDIVTFESFNR